MSHNAAPIIIKDEQRASSRVRSSSSQTSSRAEPAAKRSKHNDDERAAATTETTTRFTYCKFDVPGTNTTRKGFFCDDCLQELSEQHTEDGFEVEINELFFFRLKNGKCCTKYQPDEPFPERDTLNPDMPDCYRSCCCWCRNNEYEHMGQRELQKHCSTCPVVAAQRATRAAFSSDRHYYGEVPSKMLKALVNASLGKSFKY